MKKPRSTDDTAIHGRPSDETRNAPAARASPSHHRAARPARPNWAANAAIPSPAPASRRRRSIPRASAGLRASSSAIRRVAATDTPAVASVTKSE